MLKREPSLNSIGSDGNTSFLRAARAGHLDKVLEHLKSNIDINTSNANGLNALHLASKDGHVEVVEELLKRGAVVDAATKKGNTALHIASLAGQEEVVTLLVQHGASVNVQSQNGFTPLYMAAQENHDNVVKYLLANGANQSLATEDGFTPLAVAMQQGHDKVVTVLLENDTRGKVRLPALHIAAKKDDVKAAKLLLENEHNPDVTSKSGFTPLHIASHYGNEAIANLLIHKGADVNYAAKHNITPLHVAAKWGKANMVALLLEHGANIESKTRDGLTPLHCAARSGHEQVVDMLLERGAPISCKTKNGLAPLHMAAQGDHVDAARILLYHRAPVDEVTVDYLTALHVAAHCGHVRVAKLLLDRQADANARALNGFTPLHIACKKNRIKVVELLLKHGASIGATTESGLTPLHVASFMGCMNIVIYLLQHDANPDVPTVRGETPLHLAARANQTDIIRILLRNGAQVDARAREQQTPLHIASRLGNVDIVMLLLQHGAKVDTTTKDMYTALHIAAKEGQDEVAAVLIENGASLNATTKKGFTPLHLAAKYGNIKVAKLLLQKEAPVDAQGKNGVTPLHVASHYDHQNVALLLLDKGASPHATAKNGHTPLHIAARKNQMDIANTLLEYGAKPNAESKAGFTPLHLSAQEGHTDMSSLLIEHEANTNHPAKNGLTPLHLCAQEDRVPVAEILVKNGAQVDAATKSGFTPLHMASHYGQTNMVRFLLANGANVAATTSLHYTPLHQAAQQGHTNIVNILLENSAQPNSVTLHGQTPLHIAQKLGYISVIETLKVVTETTTTTTTTTTIEEKYKVVAPEAMQETFMSDSEEEGGEDTVLGDHSYRYLTADEMKSLGDDSLPIDVTRDERIDSNKMVTSEEQNALPPQAIEDGMSPQYITENYVEYTKKYTPDNVDIARHPINIGFLVSFLVDARGGAMRGCRHSGVRVIVPPRCAPSPTRITCRYVRPQRTPHPPPLMEGEALASRVLELGPVGAKFLGPVIIEVPHFAALRGKEREIVILRSDNGETWREHTVDASEDVLNEVLNDSFEAEDLSQLEDVSSGRITRVITHDFPQYFAIVTRIRQEVHAIGPEGGMVSSTVVPQVQAVFPQGALTKKIKVGLQAQPIDPELTAKLLGHGVAVSPVVTVEPRRRKFHKAITLSMPAPRAHSQGMINQYSGNAPTLRLLCSITGGTTRAQWEDVTGSTPLTFVNDCVSFTTTVSARFWLMDCRNIGDATKMATELYKEAIHVPFMAKFVVFAKRIDPLEARLRVFCMTDDKEDKTLEHQEHFTEVAKSRDVEVLEGKPQYIEFAGNLVPITKSGEPLQFSFRAFRENRLPFSVRVKDQHAEAVGRCLFMREPKVAKGEPPQQPICILNIVLPDDIVTETITLTDNETLKRHMFLKDNFEYYRPDPRLADMSNLLGEDWVPLADQLGLTPSEINVIKSEYPDSVAKQAQSMLRMWISQSGNKAQGDALENALMRIGREDIIPQCLNVDDVDRIPRIPKDVMQRYQKDIDTVLETIPTKRETYESKYSAEEKVVEEPSDEEDFNKSVSERRQQIEKRLTDRNIPASAQRQEIAEEITTIKRQSIVEDKIAEVEVKHKPDQTKTTTIIKTVTTDAPESKKTIAETVETTKTTTTIDYHQPTEVTVKKQFMEEEQPDRKTTVRTIITETTRTTDHIPSNEIPMHVDIRADRRDSDLLEGVTQRLETTRKTAPRISAMDDPNSPKLSKTPPPSPADFIFREQAAVIQGWNATDRESKDKPTEAVARQDVAMQGIPTTTTKHLASSEELSLDSPKLVNDADLDALTQQTNAFIEVESRREPGSEPQTLSRESRLTKQDEKTKTLSRDSSREDTSREDTSRGDDKKSKRGFFGTLKSIVGKTQDRSDSESEKSQKKEKKKEKRRDKRKKPKLPHEKPPLEPPERPPRKPKLPTPPPLAAERPEFENIPYVEASPTDLVNGISETDVPKVTDLDAMNEIPEHVKSTANDLVSDIITTSETKAQDILEKSPTGKQFVIREEIKKKIEPKIYDTGEFRIIVTPTAEPKAKDFFKADVDEKKIEKDVAEVPVRPQRRKEHIYEDIGEPAVTQPPGWKSTLYGTEPVTDIKAITQPPGWKLVLYDAEPAPDIKVLTNNLIQNEINFAGWADDAHNVYKPSEIKDKSHTLPKTSKKHGKLFGFLAKKSSKDVDESDNEKESSKEIVEKQDREPSKERTIKIESLSDEEGMDQKKGGFFGIFGKKSKKEDDHKDDKEVVDKREQEIHISSRITETEREKSPEKKSIESAVIEMKETMITASAEKPDVSPEPKLKDKKKPKKEKVLSESEDESEHKKGGLFGFFGKKGKKDSREEPPKTIQFSETVLKDMNDTNDFLQNEVKHFDDVKLFTSPTKDVLTSIKTESKKEESVIKETVTDFTTKPGEADKSVEVSTKEREKTPTKLKKKKHLQEKRESSVSEDESEGRKSGIFSLFGKKHKKDKVREKSPKIPDDTKMSEEVLKQITDTNSFLRKEVELFDDVKPINGYISSPVADEPTLTKEQVSLKDVKKDKSEATIRKETKIEHFAVKDVAKVDPITKQDVLTSATEIIRETLTTRTIVEEPIIIKQTKDTKDVHPPSAAEPRTTVKETIVQFVDGKPVETLQKTLTELPVRETDDRLAQNIATTTSFLQGEIDRFDDVKITSKEPLIIKEQVEVKKKTEDVDKEMPVITTETSPQMDKKKSRREKQDGELEDESQRKGGFFGLFGKKIKKDDGKSKKEDEKTVLKEIILSEETLQSITNCNQFLTNEISNFEDVRPIIKDIEEKHEKIIAETPVSKMYIPEAKVDVKQIEHETVFRSDKKKEKLETQSQETLEKEKKTGFFDIFGKKSKKDEKLKTREETETKEIKLSDDVLKTLKDSNEFLINEVTNYHDVRPPMVNEEKIQKIYIEKSAPKTLAHKLEKPAETVISIAQTRDFLQDVEEGKEKTVKEKTPPKTGREEEIKKEEAQPDKKKSKKEKAEPDETESQKKGGFFGLFGKKPKKEEKQLEKLELSEKALKNIADSDQFLTNEVTFFEDVRPVVQKEISEPAVFKKPETEMVSEGSDVIKIKIAQTASFLKDEVERFDDVKQVLPKSPEKAEKSSLKPTHVIKETIILRGDLPDEEIRKILDDADQFKKSTLVEQEVTKREPKPEVKEYIEEAKGGFFGLFGKKATRKDEKPQEESKTSEETIKNIAHCNDFLTNEVNFFEDVRPIITKKVTEIDKIKIIEPKAKPEKSVDKEEEIKIKISQTADFLKDEIEQFHDVKQILYKSPEKHEKPEIKPTHLIKETIIVRGNILDEEIKKILDASDETKEDIILKEEVTLDKKQPKEESSVSIDESVEKKKGGFLGLFGKKSKKDEKQSKEKSSEEVLKTIETCDQFLTDEIISFEDVRPIIRKQISEIPSVETQIDDETAKQKLAQTAAFLRDEIERFDDVKQIISESPQKEETSKLKPTHIIKETIILRGDLPDENIRKILDEEQQIKEDITVKQQTTLDKDKPKEESKLSAKKSEEKQKGGFLGLFSKKSKKDEGLESKPSEEALQLIKNCDEFLTKEIALFEDIRPITEKPASETPLIKTEEFQIKAAKPDQQIEQTKLKVTQTADFLKDEIERFDDVRQILPEPSLKDERSKPKPTHLIKETIIVRGDMSDEEIKKILSAGDKVDEDIIKQEATLEEAKPLKERKEGAEEPKEEKKGGFFGLFGKKAKKDKKEEVEGKTSEEALKLIESCDQFLTNEITSFEDVKPIIKKPVSEISLKTKIEKPDTTMEQTTDEETVIKMTQTANFLRDEVERFDDVKLVTPKSPEKSVPKPTHIIKERITLRGDIPDEDIKKILEVDDQIKEDISLKKEPTLDRKQSKEEPKTSLKEPEEKKKSGFLGLFGKKPKKDEKPSEEIVSEEFIKLIENCDQFLTNEIVSFEDVRPIVQKPTPDVSLTEVNKLETKVQVPTHRDEEIKVNIIQTDNFLRDEVQRFEDVKEVIPKSPEKDEEYLKPTHIIKETIVVRGDLPDEDIRKILEDSDLVKEDLIIKEQVTLDTKKKSEENFKTTADEVEKQGKEGFFSIFGKKPKPEHTPRQEIKTSEETLQQICNTDNFLKDEIKYFEDVMLVTKAKPLISPSKSHIKEDESREPQIIKRTPSEEYVDNVINTSNFLATEIKYFVDVRPVIKETVKEISAAAEISPKKAKKKKKGKRESSESGDDSEGSKKSGLFKLFGKKGKKDKSETKEDRTTEKIADKDTKSKHGTLESVKKAPATEEKDKAERKGSQKKSKKDKSEEDSLKPLFGIFGKKDKTPVDVPTQPAEITISETALKSMKDSSEFLTKEIEKFDDVKVPTEKFVKSDVNVDGKMTIAEITKVLEPKAYESGEFQVVVSPIGEPKRREFSISIPEKVEDIERGLMRPVEKLASSTTTAPTLTQEKLITEDIPILEADVLTRIADEGKMPMIKKQTIKITEKATPEIELSQEVLKNMIDTSNFLNQEISRYHDVKPIERERGTSPHSDEEEPKEKKKRKKKQRQKSIEDDTSRKSGFFGLFGKREKKSESPEIAMEQPSEKDKIIKEKGTQPDLIAPAQEGQPSKDVTAPLDFVESVHLTNNFLNDEIKNYHDVKPLPTQSTEVKAVSGIVETKPDLHQKEEDQRGKSKSLFGFFGKKSEEHTEEPQKESTMKEKRERRKSGSPFRLFSKKSKDDEKVEEVKPVISEQALQDMYETKNFLSTEVMRYNDAPYSSGNKPAVEIKKSVAFVDDAVIKISDVQSPAIASTTTIAKESIEDGKIRMEAIFKEIREDLQPAEKVIVVIKDDVSDTTKSVSEMTFSPPEILSKIVASIPSDSAIKDIQIETIEVDTAQLDPTELTQQFDKLKDLQETDGRPVSLDYTVKSEDEKAYKLEGFLDSQRTLADVDVSDKKRELEEDMNEKVQEITKDIRELTRELDKTVELTEDKLLSEKDDSKKETKKGGKKSGGFFSKLGGKIGGKIKQAKDDVEEAGAKVSQTSSDVIKEITEDTEDVKKSSEDQVDELRDLTKDIHEKIIKDLQEFEVETNKSIDYAKEEIKQREQEKIDAANQFLKNKERSVQRVIDSTPKVSEIGQILKTEIDKITSELQVKAQKDETITPTIQDTKETTSSIEETEERVEEIKETADVPAKTKKAARKSGGFFGKLGDKFTGKVKDTKDDGKLLAEKVDDKLKKIEGDVIKTDAKVDETIKTGEKLVSFNVEKLEEITETGAQKVTGEISETERKIEEDVKRVQDGSKHVSAEIAKDLKREMGLIIADVKEGVTEGKYKILDSLALEGTTIDRKGDTTQEQLQIKISSEKPVVKEFTSVQQDFFEDDTIKLQQDSIKDQTRDFIDQEQVSEAKVRGDREISTITSGLIPAEQTPENVKKPTKKPRKKSGGFFSKIGGIFADKGDDAAKATEASKKISDSTEDASTNLANQASDVLTDLKDKTTVAAKSTTDKVQDEGSKVAEESSRALAAVSKTTNDKVESVKEELQDVKEDVKDTASKIGSFLGGLGRKAEDIESDLADELMDISTAASDAAKETIESFEETGEDIKGETARATKGTADKIEEESTKASKKTSDVLEHVSKTVEDQARFAKEAHKTLSQDAKEQMDKTERFISSIGKKIEDINGDMSEKMKDTCETVINSAKDAKESINKVGADVIKQTGDIDMQEHTVDISKTAVDKVKKEGDKTAKSMKESTEVVNEDFKDGVKQGASKIGGFFGDLGDETGKIKDDMSDKIKDVGAVVADTSKQTVESAESTTADVTKQADVFLTNLKEQTKDLTKSAVEETKKKESEVKDKTKDAQAEIIERAKETRESTDLVKQTSDFLADLGDKTTEKVKTIEDKVSQEAAEVSEKGTIDTTVATVSEKMKRKVESLTNRGQTLAEDLKVGAGSLLDDLGEKIKEVKEDGSDKMKDASATITDAAKQTTKSAETIATDVAKQTDDFLSNLKEETSDTVEDAIKKTKEKGDEISETISETAKDSVESLKRTGKDISQDVKGGAGKIGGFLSGFGKKSKGKTKEGVDKTKQAVESTEEAAADLAKQTGDFLADLKDKTTKTIGDETSKKVSKIGEKTSDTYAAISETTKDKTESVKQSGEDIKENAGKIGGFFSSLGKKTKGKTKDVSDKTKIATESTEKATANLAKQTADFLDDLKDKTIDTTEKTGDKIKEETRQIQINGAGELEAVSKVTQKKVESIKQSGEDLSQDIHEGVSGVFGDLGKKVKDVRDDASDKMKDTSAIVADTMSQAVEWVEKEPTEVAKETGDFLVDLKDKTTDFATDAIDKAKKKSSEATQAISETTKDRAISLEHTGEVISEDVKEGLGKIGGFFGGLGKKAKSKTKDVSDKTKEAIESTEATTNLAKKTGDVVTDLKDKTVDATKEIGDEVSQEASKIGETYTAVSETTKDTAESIKHSGKSVSQDVKESAGKIEGFFSALGKKTRGKKKDVSDKTEKVIESTEEAITDLAKQTADFLTDLQDKAIDTTEKTSDKVKEETRQIQISGAGEFETVSKATEDKVESVKRGGDDLFQDFQKGVSEVGGVSDDLGEKVKDIKHDASDKIKDASVIVTDTTIQTVECVEKKSTKVAKETGDFLIDLKDKTTHYATDAFDRAEKKSSETISETTKDTADTLKRTDEVISEDVKEGLDKLGGFFGGLGKRTKTKAKGIVHKTKEAVESTKEATTDLGKQTGDFVTDLKDKTIDATKEIADEVSQEASKIGEKISDTYGKENVKSTEKVTSDTAKQTADFLADLKNSAIDTTKAISDKVKEAADVASKEIKGASVSIADVTKITVESVDKDVQRQTDDFFTKLGNETQGITKRTPEKDKDVFAKLEETVEEDTGKVHEFFGSLKDKAKDIKDDTSQDIKKVQTAAANTANLSGESLEQTTIHLAKQTSDAATNVTDKMKEAEMKTKDSIRETSADIEKQMNDFVSSLKEKTTETVRNSADETADEKVSDKTKGAKKSIKEASEGITGLFSGFENKKEKKAQDKESKCRMSDDKPCEILRTDDTSAAQEITRGLSDLEQFLSEERGRLLEESGSAREKKTEGYSKSKSPLVTSPTLPRRVASHRIARGDVPYFVEVTNLTHEDSSSDESYIVTEPTEQHTARISDETSAEAERKRKPLFHIESEEDSSDLRRTGSVKSNILERLSAERLDSLVTDLDDIDDNVPTDTQFTSNVLFEGDKTAAKSPSQIETDIIEKKLSDIEKALGTLEQAETIESSKMEKPSLKRVERKFERMASELMAENAASAKDSDLTTPEMDDKHERDFHKIVSQLSTEEMSECQKEYAALWDEQTFSPSEGCDTSKTPDSQADVLELPQGETYGVQQRPDQPQSTPQTFARAEAEESAGQRQPTDHDRPIADQHMLSDEMKRLLKELEEENKK